jgi:hypothetical protein
MVVKKIIRHCLIFLLFCSTKVAQAQNDSIWLQCPLNDATIVPPPKNAIHWDEPDMCIVLKSIPDSMAKACYAGRVSNVQMTEDGKWDVVFYFKDYYFWYSGLEKPLVRKNDNLKIGQPVGTILPGGKMEFLLFKFETPLDPTRYLGCKEVLKGN